MAISDESSKLPGLGIFAYTKGVPIMVNTNIYTDLGIVNGKEGQLTLPLIHRLRWYMLGIIFIFSRNLLFVYMWRLNIASSNNFVG
jgi:hypothetical protein